MIRNDRPRLCTSKRNYNTNSLLLFVIAIYLLVQPKLSAADDGAIKSPSQSLVPLHMKFEGSATCASAQCHGGTDVKPPPETPGNEFTVWSGKDKHNAAYNNLSNPESQGIAKKLGIASAAASDKCLSCHALNAPAELKGDHFDIAEGVTCNACHGPSEKWSQPHSKEGWLDAQRAALPVHHDLLAKWGIYNTRPVDARANRCASCHLAIDAEMVKAGHRQPVFELAYFSETEPKHWREPEGYFVVQLWAGGQAVCLRDAMRQVANRISGGAAQAQIDDALSQAKSHYQMVRQLLATGAIPGDVGALDSAVAAMTGADTAKQAAMVSDMAAKMVQAASETQFDKAKVVKLLTALANDDGPSKLGSRGQEQQGMAVYEIYSAYAANEKVSDDAMTTLVGKLPPDPGQPAPADYADTLKAVVAKIPK
jgi:hypothetical protein